MTYIWPILFLHYNIMEFAICSSLSFVVISNVGDLIFFTMVEIERAHLVLPYVFLSGWSALSKWQSGMLVLDKWGCIRCNSKDGFNHHPLPSLLMVRRYWSCQLLYWCSPRWVKFICSPKCALSSVSIKNPCAGLPCFATLWFLHGQLISSSCSRQVSL